VVLQVGDFGLWSDDAGEGFLDASELACLQAGVVVC
jgi:hypothetical protein